MSASSDSSFERPKLPITDSDVSTALVESLFRNPVKVAQQAQPTNNTSASSYNLENSTYRSIDFDFLNNKVNIIFADAKEEIFEDGMESDFSRNLSKFILSFGHSAMETIIPVILSAHTNTEVVSEALRVLGRINHKTTYRDRLWLLERGLYSASARVRDGAILGLAFMNDSIAIAPIKSAIERERIPELRQDMEQVLAQLEGNENGISAKKDS
jgi:hypothetical protein